MIRRLRALARGDDASASTTEPLWTSTFALLTVSMGLAYASQALLIPSVPLFLDALGASGAVIGLVLAAQSGFSFFARPMVGVWSDRWTAPGVMLVGALGLGLTGFAHVVAVVWVLAAVGAVRGATWAALNTGGYAHLAQVVPPSRRAEGTAHFTLWQFVPLAGFPAFAVWIVSASPAGFAIVFLLSGLAGLGAAAIVWPLARAARARATARHGPRPGLTLVGLFWPGQAVFLASALSLFSALTFPTASSFVPLYAQARGIPDIGWYYLGNAAAGLLARLALGMVMDRVGLARTCALGFVLMVAGLGLMVATPLLPVVVLGGAVYAVGQACIVTATVVIVMEQADPRQRGAAMAAYTAAFPLGQSGGSAFSGLALELGGYAAMFAGAMVFNAIGLGLTLRYWRRIGRA